MTDRIAPGRRCRWQGPTAAAAPMVSGQDHGCWCALPVIALVLVHPERLLWALLAVPVVVFGLWKLRIVQRRIATGFLWQQVATARPARFGLRRVVSLVVQLAVLLALVAALADPRARPARQLVVVVDNSASMQATDVAPSRLEAAKRMAAQLAAGLCEGEAMAVLSAGPVATPRCGLTDRREVLDKALAGIGPTRGSAQVAEAVELGRQMLAGRRGGRIVVLSDGGFPGAERLAGQPDVQLIVLGRRVDNAAVGRLAARRAPADPLRCQVLVEVASYAGKPIQAELEVTLRDRLVATVPLAVEPGGRWARVFEMTTPVGGRLVARLRSQDALPADDVAIAHVPPAGQRHVLLVGPSHPSLRAALEADPRVRLSVAESPAADPRPGSILVFQGQVPEPLPPGPLLVVDPESGCELWQVGQPRRLGLVAAQREGSAILSGVRLEGVGIGTCRPLVPSPGATSNVTTLAWTADRVPVALAIQRAAGRVAVFCFGLEQSDVTQRPAWPVLVSNALGWLAEPSQSRETLRAAADRDQSRPVPPEESDLRPPPALEKGRWQDTVVADRAVPVWPYLAAVALGAAVVEWYLFQRRWIS